MHILAEAFSLPKAGNSPAEYEDAFFPSEDIDSDQEEFRCAVADGATQTIFSKKWANLLVEDFCRSLLEIEVLATRTSLLRSEWLQFVESKRPLPWYAEEKVEKGAFSSLMGLSIKTVRSRSTAKGIWQCLAIGDSALFQVRADELIRAFPLEASSQFTSGPRLLSTNQEANQEIDELAVGLCGTWEFDDSFFLMTDALAIWFLRAFEAGEKPWTSIFHILTLPVGRAHAFEEWITDLRRGNRMPNDDVTLIAVTVAS